MKVLARLRGALPGGWAPLSTEQDQKPWVIALDLLADTIPALLLLAVMIPPARLVVTVAS